MLNWEIFKTKMMDRFFSSAMRDEKLKEFLYPRVKGLRMPEKAHEVNHLPQWWTQRVNGIARLPPL